MMLEASDWTLVNREVCEVLGISRWTLRRILPEDLPYALTSGDHRRYRAADVLAYIDRRSPS